MQAIEQRRSIRKYLDRPVDESVVTEILRSASLAPSGSNTQPWHFIVVDDNELKQSIAKVSHNQQWMLTAPLFIVCVADIRVRIKEDNALFLDEESTQFELKQIIRDTAIAIDHLLLEATDRGVGTCWVAWFKQNELRPLLGIPDDKFVVGVITLGYAAEAPKPRPRKPLHEIVHRNRW